VLLASLEAFSLETLVVGFASIIGETLLLLSIAASN